MPDNKTYKVGEDVYEIPHTESDSFLKDNPDAIEVNSFLVGKDTLDIPVNEVSSFLKEMPDAKPLKKKEQTQSQSNVDSGISASMGAPVGYAPRSFGKTEPPKTEVANPQKSAYSVTLSDGSLSSNPEILKKQIAEQKKADAVKRAERNIEDIDKQVVDISRSWNQAKQNQEQNYATLEQLQAKINDPNTPEDIRESLVGVYNQTLEGAKKNEASEKLIREKAIALQQSKSTLKKVQEVQEDLEMNRDDNFLKATGNFLAHIYNAVPQTVAGAGALLESGGDLGVIGPSSTAYDALLGKGAGEHKITDVIGDAIQDFGDSMKIETNAKYDDKHYISSTIGDIVGSIAVSAIPGGAVAKAGKAGQMMLGATTATMQMADGVHDKAKAAGLSDTDAGIMTLTIAPISGLLEIWGASNIIDNAVGKKVIAELIDESTKKLAGKEITKELIFDTVGDTFKTVANKYGLNAARSAGEEGLTELGQAELEAGAENLYDLTQDKPAYGTEFFSTKTQLDAAKQAAIGALAGSTIGVLSGVSTPRNIYDKAIQLKSDPNKLAQFQEMLATEVSAGHITPEQAQQVTGNIEAMIQVDEKVPSTVTDTDKRFQAVELIKEKTELQKEVSGLDHAMAAPIMDRISEINSDLELIARGKDRTNMARKDLTATADAISKDVLEGKKVELTEQEKAKDLEILAIQGKRNELGAGQEILNIPENVSTVIDRLADNKPVDAVALTEAKDALFSEYNKLKALKTDPKRIFTIDQINEAMDQLDLAAKEIDQYGIEKTAINEEIPRLDNNSLPLQDQKTPNEQAQIQSGESSGIDSGAIKENSEGVRYNGQDAIGTRGRSQSDKNAARVQAKEKIKNPETNASLKAANSYNKSAGLPPITPHKYAKAVKETAEKTASAFATLQDVNRPNYKETPQEKAIYEAYKSQYPEMIKEHDIKNYKDLVKKSYQQLIKEVEAQYNALPIKVSWHDGDKNYEGSPDMLDDVHNFNHLWVYRGGDDHVELGSKTVDKDGLTANDKFRAVHDYFGHSIGGNQFGKDGEENAWIEHSKMFSKLAQIAVSSETRGQNSYVNFSGVNTDALAKISLGSKLKSEGIKEGNQENIDKGEALLAEGNSEFQYAEQKAIALPPEMTDAESFLDKKPEKQIGISKEERAKQAERLNFPPLPPIDSNISEHTWKVLNEEANRLVDSGTVDPMKLVDDVLENDRTTDDLEKTILLKAATKIENKITGIQEKVNEAVAAGDKKMADLNRDLLVEQLALLNKIHTVLSIEGTKAGRNLAAMKQSMKDNYSLGALYTKYTTANKGVAPDPLMVEKIIEHDAKLQEMEAKLKAAEEMIAEMNKQIKEKPPTVKEKKEKIKKEINDTFAAWKKDREDRGKIEPNQPFVVKNSLIEITNADIIFAAKIVKSYVELGVLTTGEAAAKLRRDAKEILGVKLSEEDIDKVFSEEVDGKKLYDEFENTGIVGDIKKTKERLEVLRENLKDPEKYFKALDEAAKARANKENYKSAELKEMEAEIKEASQKLRVDRVKYKRKIDNETQALELANRTPWQKTKDFIYNALNVPRTLMASFDFSAPFRQGIIASVAHPTSALKATKEMFKQFASPKAYENWIAEYNLTPESELAKKSGLYVADASALNLNAKEEAFQTNLIQKFGHMLKKIPVVGKLLAIPSSLVDASERGYVGYLNKLRTDVFKNGSEILMKQGMTFKTHPKEFEALADFINTTTGRGKIGNKALEDSAKVLNAAFFSPRLIASRINFLNLVKTANMPPAARRMALKDTAAFLSFAATTLLMAAAAGLDVEKDPRSSDFGKVRSGDTRVEFLGGIAAYIHALVKIASGQKKDLNTGGIIDLDAGSEFKGSNRGLELLKFGRQKFAPMHATFWNMMFGKDTMGDPVTWDSEMYKNLTPLIYQDMSEAFASGGISKVMETIVPAIFGISVKTYDKKQDGKKKLKKDFKKLLTRKLG